MMTDEERAQHKAKLLLGLEASQQLLPRATEDGAVLLLQMCLRGIAMMHSERLLSTADMLEQQQRLQGAFADAHPSLDAQQKAGRLLRSETLEQVLAHDGPVSEQIERGQALLRAFYESGLRKPH